MAKRTQQLLMSVYPLLAKLRKGKTTKAGVSISFNVFKTKRSEAPCWEVQWVSNGSDTGVVRSNRRGS